MSKLKCFYLDSWLHFGKYDEKTLREVLTEDPSYFDWCLINVSYFSIDPDEYRKIQTEFPNLKISEGAEKELFNKFEILEGMKYDAREADTREFYTSYDAYEGDQISWLGDNG